MPNERVSLTIHSAISHTFYWIRFAKKGDVCRTTHATNLKNYIDENDMNGMDE